MTIERLLEAAKRLSIPPYGLAWVTMDVDEHHVVDKAGYQLKSRSGKLQCFRYAGAGTAGDNVIRVGNAEVDINGIVTSIKYDEKAPWWAVKPFQDAMEGK